MTTPPAKTAQDVTSQSLSLARIVDRLSNGTYTIQIEKGNRFDAWRLCIWDDSGRTVRDMDLFRKWD